MPSKYVKKLAKKHGVSPQKSEGRWRRAKRAAAKQGHGDNYAYITGIYKRMMHESHTLISRVLARLAVSSGSGKLTGIVTQHQYDGTYELGLVMVKMKGHSLDREVYDFDNRKLKLPKSTSVTFNLKMVDGEQTAVNVQQGQ